MSLVHAANRTLESASLRMSWHRAASACTPSPNNINSPNLCSSLYCTHDDDTVCPRSFLDPFLDTIDSFSLALAHSSLNLSSSPSQSRLKELFICCVTLFPDVLCSRAISDLVFNGGMSRYSPIPRTRRSSSAFGSGGLALLTELRRRTQPLALSGCQCLHVGISSK